MVDRGPRKHGRHRQSVMREHEGICHLCGEPYADAIDHIIPVAHGGSDHPDNLRPAHTKCNSSKRDTLPHDWESLPATCWVGEKGRVPTPEEIREHVARNKMERQREKERQKRQQAEQRRAEREAARQAESNAKKARVGAEVRRLEAERLEARQELAAISAEPQPRIPIGGYWPWLLPVGVFFATNYFWGTTPAWLVTILSLPLIGLPVFLHVNRKAIEERARRSRRRSELEAIERRADWSIRDQQRSLKPRYSRYGSSRRRSYRRSYRRW